MSMLVLEGLSVRYGASVVVREVSLELCSGDALGLIGPNLAGKTALLRGMAGLAATSGRLSLDGESLDRCSPQERVRRGIVLCPAERGLFPDMSVEENLLMGAFLRDDQSEIQRDLTALRNRVPRLRQRWKVKAGHLSGGEQRMLAVAKAVMARPRFLLLDEPSQGLAPGFRSALADLVRSGLGPQPPGVLLAEQSSELALELAPQLLVLRQGRVVDTGSTAALSAHQGAAADLL